MKDSSQMDDSGLRSGTLRVAFKEWPPITIKSSENGQMIFTGMGIELLDELSRRLGTSFQYIDYPGEGWGSFVNGTWNGLLGLLYRQEVDLIASLYTFEKDRNDYFDMSYPVIFNTPNLCVYRKPPTQTSMLEIGLRMFDWKVLFLTFISLILATFAITLDTMFRHRKECSNSYSRFAFTLFLGHLYHLGGNFLKQGNPGVDSQINRFVHGSWCLFCLVISSVVTATLIASLSTAKHTIPFTSIQQLINQDTYTWGMEKDATVYLYAQHSNKNSSWFKFWSGTQLFLQSDPDVLSTSVDLQLRKVKEGNYVFAASQLLVNTELATDCNLTFFDSGMISSFSSLIFRKASPYTDIFSKQIVQLHESGILDKINRKWITKSTNCAPERTMGHKFDLPKLDIIFYLLLIGIGVDVLLLFLEIVWNRFADKYF